MDLVRGKRGQSAVEFNELIPAQWVIEFRGVRPSRHSTAEDRIFVLCSPRVIESWPALFCSLGNADQLWAIMKF